MKYSEFINNVKHLFNKIDEGEETFVDLKKEDGSIVRVEQKETIEEGDALKTVNENGEVANAEDGEHTLEDGRTVTVEAGSIKEIKEASNEEENSNEEAEVNLSQDTGEETEASTESNENPSEGSTEETSSTEDNSESSSEEGSTNLEERVENLEAILKEMKAHFEKVSDLEERVEKLSKEPAPSKQRKEEKFYGEVKNTKKKNKEKAIDIIRKARN